MGKHVRHGAAKDPRSGYALLMIFCMAAMLSIMLYSQLPRVAFEAQRDKEQLLIDRGQEYSRAVLLFVRKNKKFPPTMEALENTNNIRYLRRKYKDPMTGKDEWRLIHVGPNGVFTDSLVYGKKDKTATEKQTFITEMQQIGGSPQTADAGVNLALRKRQSDGPNAPGTGDALPVDPNAPTAAGVQAGQTPGSGLPLGVQLPPGLATQQQGNTLPGQANSPVPGVAPYPVAAGANGQPPPPGSPQPGAPNAASNLIQNLLTTPRPGGQFGTPVAASGTGTTGQTTIGGGIAGVASNLEREGIKTYNEKTAYNEWEFVYDMSKDPAMANQTQATQQQQKPANGQTQPGQTQPGQTVNPVPFGGVPGPRLVAPGPVQ